jgi:hypothetical protein
MKMHTKKPAPELRTGMYVIPHTHRVKTAKLDPLAPEKVAHTYETAALAYPSNHPMRIYKDKKRALKQAKQSN